ncbi:hypothetical protein [Lysinibacillus fusiformis]|uniref:hypothetical protein n=1 Tax=Lysinibacillus fusiformis TaxID=28031 RepID=UPI002E1C0AE5|nr:hypothetical protein [Lysinibacillus fusiformis]
MVKYYYEKFTAIEIPVYMYSYVLGSPLQGGVQEKTGYTGHSFDNSTGKFTLTGTQKTINPYGDFGPVYVLGGNNGQQLLEYSVQQYSNPIQYRASTVTQTLLRTDYSKGPLVQSNFAAEDGTYPTDGRHTDGYWYVRGGVVNTAPTQPGPFTQPSGTLEIGDSKVFAVGAASDAEGNLSKYIWEASINGGAYSKVGETTTNSLTYTIPTATSLKMRVKAVDLTSLESAYRESSLYTVQTPQYYFDKYNVEAKRTYQDTAPWTYSYETETTVEGLRKNYTFDPATNKYILGELWGPGVSITDKALIYNAAFDGSFLALYELPAFSGTGNTSTRYKLVKVYTKYADKNTFTTQDARGSLVQTGVIGNATAYPEDGRHTDGFWYVRKSRVNQSIAPPTPFTSPIQGKKFKPSEAATITFGASNAANLSVYEVDYRYNVTGTWTPLAYNNTLTRSLTITTDKTLKTLELRVRTKDTSNVYSDYVYSEPFEIEHNVAPTVSLTGPGDNTTLYENDTLTIGGTAFDTDPDQAVTVYYQINAEPRKVLTTNLSKMQIALSKQLTFKAGKIYDGETVLTESLAAGIAHKLKVWAIDNENASSVVVERTFFVVPNRAPMLTLNAVVPTGVVDVDKFKISGNASDEDANSTVKVTRKINGWDPVEIFSGQGGVWEFEISLGELVVGENTIVIEVIDNYGAKTSKTIRLNKNEVKTPILQSVARYKIEPPKGSARGVLIWVQRDEELDLTVELSMTLQGEQENYVLLEADPDLIIPVTDGVVEDEYHYETIEPKDNIILKLTSTRANIQVDNKIYLIMGVVE